MNVLKWPLLTALGVSALGVQGATGPSVKQSSLQTPSFYPITGREYGVHSILGQKDRKGNISCKVKQEDFYGNPDIGNPNLITSLDVSGRNPTMSECNALHWYMVKDSLNTAGKYLHRLVSSKDNSVFVERASFEGRTFEESRQNNCLVGKHGVVYKNGTRVNHPLNILAKVSENSKNQGPWLPTVPLTLLSKIGNLAEKTRDGLIKCTKFWTMGHYWGSKDIADPKHARHFPLGWMQYDKCDPGTAQKAKKLLVGLKAGKWLDMTIQNENNGDRSHWALVQKGKKSCLTGRNKISYNDDKGTTIVRNATICQEIQPFPNNRCNPEQSLNNLSGFNIYRKKA